MISSPLPTLRWGPGPEWPRLDRDDVHVWCVGLDQQAASVTSLERILDEGERTRAARFYFVKDRTRFIIAHGILRLILGRYLKVRPDELRYSYNRYGKPILTKAFRGDHLRLNLSHSHGLALYAMALGRELGIDVERLRADLAGDRIALQFFSPQEVSMLRAVPAHQRLQAFFNCWTRKEAYVKARGEGLSLPLADFVVSLVPGERPALLNVKADPKETSRWSLRALSPAPGYIGAVAVEGQNYRLTHWQWPEHRRPV